MTKKLSFKNISIFLCLVPMLILSIFCLVPKKQDIDVFADYTISSYTFTGSNLVTTCTPAKDRTAQGFHFVSFQVELSFVNNEYNLRLFGTSMGRGASETFGNPHPFDSSFVITANEEFSVSPPMTDATSYSIPFDYSFSGVFNGTVYRVELGCDVTGTSSSSSTISRFYNYVKYFDTNDNYLKVRIQSIAGGTNYDLNTYSTINKFKFENRTYYLDLDFSSNNYYDIGYQDGYNAGVSDGNNTGYQDGYNSGYNIGYTEGYDIGVDVGNDYSFSSLFGAVIDTPVTAFTSLLNFEIFGVNILGLVTGLLSLAVIVFIVKLCLGGK